MVCGRVVREKKQLFVVVLLRLEGALDSRKLRVEADTSTVDIDDW